MDTTKAITHLSLCSGYEGIGLGLRSVLPTLREIAYVEREGFPVANLVAKMEAGELDAAPVFTDVKTFPYGKFRGIVDILSGGFPCQPFSAAGKRQATEDPRHLFPYIADGIRECQPRIVFLENVQGILSCKTADGEPVLQYVLRELEGMGYRATAGIFSAEEVGAPHQRKRVFILGVREELGNASSDGCQDGCSEAVGEERPSEQGWVQEPRRGSNATPELANGISSGLEGHSGHEYGEGRQSTGQSRSTPKGGLLSRWPSRPSEPQYEWEEPRVVGDTKIIDRDVSNDNGELGQSECREPRGAAGETINRGQAEPQLGRASNGSSSRVDRLRLLGNGVVPQTAAKAFITLINRLI